MKFLALKVDFNSISFGPLGSRSCPHRGIKFGHPLQNARFLLLSINLAWKQIPLKILSI